MKITVIFFLVLAAIVASVYGAKATPRPNKKCIRDCGTNDYKPVCGGDGSGKGNKSFGNECVLSNYNCESGSKFKVVSQGECPGGGGVRLQ